MQKAKKILRRIVTVILIIVLLISLFEIAQFLLQNREEKQAVEQINEIIEPNVEQTDTEFTFSHEAWNQLKAINDDFIGYLAFPDGYVKEPIVKAFDRAYYLHHWIDKSWNSQGTVYMDQQNELTDTNITMYGHNVTYDPNARFSPLTKLVNQEDYNNHHEFKIWYETEVVSYEIEAVYYYDTDTEDFNFRKNNFDNEEEITSFLSEINKRNEILSVGGMTKDDRFVTFQTCKGYSSSVRIILVAKEVARSLY